MPPTSIDPRVSQSLFKSENMLQGVLQKGQKGVLAVRARGHFHKKGPIDMQIRQNGGFVLVEGRLLQISQTGSQQPRSIVSSAIRARCACALFCVPIACAPLFVVGLVRVWIMVEPCPWAHFIGFDL